MTAPLDIVRGFYAALGRGDVASIVTLFDPGIEWTEAESFPYYGGTWRGPAAIVEGLFEPLARDWIRFDVEARQFVAEADQVISLGRYIGVHGRTKRPVTAPFAHHWTVTGGKIVRFVQYSDTAKFREAVAG